MCNCGCETLNDLDGEVTECIYQTHRADRNGPAEFCDHDTIPGTPYCQRHQPRDY